MSMSTPPDTGQKASAAQAEAHRLFVQPQTYRRRRIMDTVRALPVLGVLLWAVPLLWGTGGVGPSASSALVFVFAVWIGLVGAAAILARRLAREDATDRADPS